MPEPSDPTPGGAIIRASWTATAVFTATATAATVWPDHLVVVSVPVALALLVVGLAAFVLAYARAVERSRTVEIGIGGWFFLAGTAPKAVRRHLMGSLALQVVVAFATASVRIFTPLAFGMLAPMCGLGLAGLWGARYGSFASRRPPESGAASRTGVHKPSVMDQNAGHG